MRQPTIAAKLRLHSPWQQSFIFLTTAFTAFFVA